MTVKDHNDEVVRKLTERNKIAEFAMTTLGCDERRADGFVKVCGEYFVWDGTLRFKGASGEVPADDPQCTGFFQREFDYLVPTKSAAEKAAEVPAEILESALAGNITALGRVNRIRGDADMAATEKFLTAERAKVSGKKPSGDNKSTNPWSAAGWSVTAQGQVARADLALAHRLAKAAGSYIGATKPKAA